MQHHSPRCPRGQKFERQAARAALGFIPPVPPAGPLWCGRKGGQAARTVPDASGWHWRARAPVAIVTLGGMSYYEQVALTMLKRFGVRAIWQLHLSAARAYRNGNALSA